MKVGSFVEETVVYMGTTFSATNNRFYWGSLSNKKWK